MKKKFKIKHIAIIIPFLAIAFFSIFFIVGYNPLASKDSLFFNKISECQNITEPGTYLINKNIEPKLDLCIAILASDVEVDCQNHIIYGPDTQNSIAFKISDSFMILNNITVKNCKFKDWDIGIWAEYSTNVSSINIVASSAPKRFGILYQHVNNSLIKNLKAIDQSGVYFNRAENNRISGLFVKNTKERAYASHGLYLDWGSVNNTAENIAIKGTINGIYIEKAYFNLFNNFILEDVGNSFFFQHNSASNKFSNFLIKNSDVDAEFDMDGDLNNTIFINGTFDNINKTVLNVKIKNQSINTTFLNVVYKP